MRQQVESDPNSIGFLSNYQANKGGLNSVEFNGVACNQTTAAAGTYGGVAVFFEVTKGPAKGAALAFINWIDKSAAGEKNHRQPVDPDRLAVCWNGCASHGLTTAPSVRSARCRCWSA